MPKAVAIDNDAPRRRRSAIKVDAKPGTRAGASSRVKAERGLLMRLLLRSPKDTAAAILAFAAVVAIIVNALFLQAGHHPSPMFGAAAPMPLPVAMSASVNPLPRPRPSEADAARRYLATGMRPGASPSRAARRTPSAPTRPWGS